MSVEDILTQIGPGAPMGTLMRQMAKQVELLDQSLANFKALKPRGSNLENALAVTWDVLLVLLSSRDSTSHRAGAAAGRPFALRQDRRWRPQKTNQAPRVLLHTLGESE